MTANMRSKLHVYGYATGTYFDAVGTYTKDVAEDWDYFYDYVDPDDASAQPTTAAITWNTGDPREEYHMYVAWQNPDGQATITFDGIEAKVWAELTLPTEWSTPAEVKNVKPDIQMHFQDNTVKGFDISPPSAFTKGDTVMDTSQGGVENIQLADAVD